MKNVICISEDSEVQKNFEARVERLNEGLRDDELLQTLMVDLLDEKKRDLAYAKLAALDLLSEPYSMGFLGTEEFDVMVLQDDEPTEDDDSDAYELAEDTKDMVLKNFGSKIITDHMQLAVLVNLPWNNDKNERYKYIDETYYRALTRRTFIQYRGDGMYEKVMNKLAGILVIDERDVPGKVQCYAYCNPNREVEDSVIIG